jgi:hypothetical protein
MLRRAPATVCALSLSLSLLAGCGGGTTTTVVSVVTRTSAPSATTATTTTSESPRQTIVLGAAAFAPGGNGWGTERPVDIFNGGDPSGHVFDIQWTSWGGAKAEGHGLNPIFKPQGGYYTQPARIELQASDPGKCTPGGPLAYRQLLFRVASRPGGPLGPWMLWSGQRTVCRFA